MVRDENTIELVVIYTHRAGEGFNRSTRMVRIICQFHFALPDLQTMKSLKPLINLDGRLPVALQVLSPRQNAEQHRHPMEQRGKFDAAKVQKAGHCGTNLLDIVA